MGFTPISMYKTRKEADTGEGKQVTIKPKTTAKVKTFTFPAFNRPVAGYLIGPSEATVFFNKRSYNFIYALIDYTYCWIDLNTTEIVGVEVERNEFGGYRFREKETKQVDSTKETRTKVKETKPRGRKSKAESVTA
jgi:hypothetical protein